MDNGAIQLVLLAPRHEERHAIHSDGSSSATAAARQGELTPNSRYLQNIETGEIANSQNAFVPSSDFDRTISNAQALLARLLPPNGTARQWDGPLGARWSPVSEVTVQSDTQWQKKSALPVIPTTTQPRDWFTERNLRFLVIMLACIGLLILLTVCGCRYMCRKLRKHAGARGPLPASRYQAYQYLGPSVNKHKFCFGPTVHRHGERYALHGDGSPSATAAARQGQLTPEGIRQLHQQGQLLRKRYLRYIETGDIVTSKNVFVSSSDLDRTINSAQALLAGLLPPNGTARQCDGPLGALWSPVPVRSIPLESDNLIRVHNDQCPMFARMREGISFSLPALALKTKMKDFIAFVEPYVLKTYGNMDDKFMETCESVHDVLHYTRRQAALVNNTIPMWPASMAAWMNVSIADTFEQIADIRMHIMVGGNRDNQRIYYRAGTFLRDIFQRMDAANANDTTTKDLKIVIYSGHDENVAALLAALHQYNYTLDGPNKGIPDFAAMIIIELYDNNTVRFLMMNEPSPSGTLDEPEILMHAECPVEFCPLARLRGLMSEVTVQSDAQWQMKCAFPVIPTTTQPRDWFVHPQNETECNLRLLIIVLASFGGCGLGYTLFKLFGFIRRKWRNKDDTMELLPSSRYRSV